jgi:ABC-2 type transport system permease protein
MTTISAPRSPGSRGTTPRLATARSFSSGLLDTQVMTAREIRRSLRSIDSLLTSLMLPVAILTMFVFVFGGAISSGGEYVNYVVPGIILLCAGFGSAATAVSVAQDMTTGTIDRFRTMPIFGSSVLVGHVAASVVRNLVAGAIVVGFALLYGFRPSASPTDWLLAIGLVVLFVLAFTWVACALGLVVGPEAANGLTFLMIFLPYVSSGFVRTDTMPVVLQAFATNQPVTPVVETLRGLLTGTPTSGTGRSAVAWCFGILLVGYVAATAIYKRRRAG